MSIAGSRYRAEIWQEGFTGKPVELTFPYETPVSIEWAEVDKLEPVMSSAATLMVVSETDRQFVNLYTTQAGSTRLDIYRNNKLYWSGMLDPEIYEEPFSRERDYEVSLTFSDFALLDRIAFEQTGTNNRQRIKLRTVLDMAMKQSGINTGADWQTHISTTTSAGASLLDGVYVSEDNFFDEDGEPMTLREVLEGVLRPFGLQMVQKDGRINLYDLHALSEGLQPRRVRWCLSDSALGVDKTYNNCELTYSPYMSSNLVDASIEPGTIKDTACTTHRVNVDYSDQNYPGFDMLLHPLSLKQRKFRVLDAFNLTKFFKIKPIFSGDSEAGVAVVFDTRTGHKTYAQQCSRILNAGLPSVTIEMHDRPYVFVDPALRGNYLLNLKIEALVDVRYNPFEDASKDNEEGWWKDFQKRCHYGYIPFRLVLRDDQGRALYHYDNSTVVNTPLLSFMVYTTGRKWEPGEGTWGNAYAAYYDKEDRSKKAGWGGWKTNRPIMGYTLLLPSIFDKMFDGEYIPMPPTSGWLELSIGNTFRTIENDFVPIAPPILPPIVAPSDYTLRQGVGEKRHRPACMGGEKRPRDTEAGHRLWHPARWRTPHGSRTILHRRRRRNHRLPPCRGDGQGGTAAPGHGLQPVPRAQEEALGHGRLGEQVLDAHRRARGGSLHGRLRGAEPAPRREQPDDDRDCNRQLYGGTL